MGLSISGLEELAEETEGMAERSADLTPALDDAAAQIKAFIEERFDSREAPDGTRWEPVTLHTATYAETDGLGLKRSRFASVRFESVAYGAKASFADVHQLGDDRVPARPYAPTERDGGPSAELVDRIGARIKGYIAGTR